MSTGNSFQFTSLVVENKRFCIYAAALLILVFFGDSILLFIGHCLHLIFEFLASVIEHWLHAVFNLTERQAQIAYFYLFITLSGLMLWRISKAVFKKAKQFCISASCLAKVKTERMSWPKLTFWLTVFGTSVFLLT
jgi:hypothetical protein